MREILIKSNKSNVIVIDRKYLSIINKTTTLQRAINTTIAVESLDRETIIEKDGSAAARIIPMINTFTEIDLMQKEAWIGN